jgi:hypothetical protein
MRVVVPFRTQRRFFAELALRADSAKGLRFYYLEPS